MKSIKLSLLILSAAGAVASVAMAGAVVAAGNKPVMLNPQPEPPGRRQEEMRRVPEPIAFCRINPERRKQCTVIWDRCKASLVICQREWRACCTRK